MGAGQSERGAKPVVNFSVAPRADGTRQRAYKGKPVYGFAGDACDRLNGDGVDEV